MTLKLGKKPATPKKTDFKLSTYLDLEALPPIPGTFGFDAVYPPSGWGMLGNDRYGCCVWSGAAHEHMVLTARGRGPSAGFTKENVLGDYAAATGFDPQDPDSDQGTYVHDAMSYRRRTGILDAVGTRHTIGAYLSLDTDDLVEVWQALYIFETVGLGIDFPVSAMDQFNAGERWSVVRGSPIEGGHYINLQSKQGTNQDKGTMKIVTWGRLQAMTDPFFRTYCDEAWCYVSADVIRPGGTTIRGFNAEQLAADLAALD